MGVVVYKNEHNGRVLFLDSKPKVDKKIHSMHIGIITGEIGNQYPRVYNIPVGIPEETYARVASKKYWDSCSLDIPDFNDYGFDKECLVKKGLLSNDDVKSVFSPHGCGIVGHSEFDVENFEKDMDHRKLMEEAMVERPSDGDMNALSDYLALFGRQTIEGIPEKIYNLRLRKRSRSIAGFSAVVLQTTRVDTTDMKIPAGISRTLFEEGETVMIQCRGSYRPAIHKINGGSGVLYDLKLFKTLPSEISREDFIKACSSKEA